MTPRPRAGRTSRLGSLAVEVAASFSLQLGGEEDYGPAPEQCGKLGRYAEPPMDASLLLFATGPSCRRPDLTPEFPQHRPAVGYHPTFSGAGFRPSHPFTIAGSELERFFAWVAAPRTTSSRFAASSKPSGSACRPMASAPSRAASPRSNGNSIAKAS